MRTVLLGLMAASAFGMQPGPAVAADSPVDATSKLELVSADFGLADGPAWDGHGALLVPDVKGALIRKFVPATGEWSTVVTGDHRFSASYFSHGRLFVSNNSGAKIESYDVAKFDQPATLVAKCDEAEPAKRRPNDLVVDAAGGVYYTLTGQNEVVYVNAAGQSSVATKEAESPNGITMSPDFKVLYVAAYKPKKIVALNVVEPGRTTHAREFAIMDDGPELGADGMTTDSAGNIYCAGATDVWIWNPEGKLLARINCPTRPINCTFGDKDLKTLYITGFGGLYRQRMTVAGR